MEADFRHSRNCLKCDQPLGDANDGNLYEIDVAHAGEDRERAREKVWAALDHALRKGYAGLRVIHGYGSSVGRRAVIKDEVLRLLREIECRHGYELSPEGANRGASRLVF
jgi:DNA-nicking Smr family endonuclease